MPLKLNLFTEWYVDKSPERQAELWRALVNNIENPHVDRIFLFGDHQDLLHAPEHRKIWPRVSWDRPSFAQLFQYAAVECSPGALCAIANADIYFDGTLAALDGAELDGLALCLSRWDVQADGSARLHDRAYSQDAWIFRNPVRVDGATFIPGQRGCDNRLAFELQRAGLRLCNPALTVKAYHLHLSQKRGARGLVPPPYVTVLPTTLEKGLAACRR